MAKIVLILLGVCFACVTEPFHTRILITVSLLLLMIRYKDNINVVHLCGILLAVYLVETLLFKFVIVNQSDTLSDMAVNAIIFGAHFLIDLLLFVLVSLRAPFSRSRLEAQGKPTDHVFIYNAEFALTSLFVVFMAVDLLALGENFIRHLDDLGLSAELAQTFSGWNWLYYKYEYVKSMLLGLTFLLLWTITYPVGQQAYKEAKAS